MTYDIWRTRYQTEATEARSCFQPSTRLASMAKARQLKKAGDKEMDLTPTQGADQLRQYIERIERLEEEKRALMADVRDVYSEAKHSGFDPKTMRQIVKIRAMDSELLAEQDTLLTTYREALGLG